MTDNNKGRRLTTPLRSAKNEVRFFTFGREHTLPDGTPAKDRYVKVSAPSGVDHRALFIAWLGSNKFSSEYTLTEWMDSGMEAFAMSMHAYIIVSELK